MTLDELALKITKDILVFKWMFVPETRCIRIWTIVNKNDEVIDVRDISEDELYGHEMRMKDLIAEACKERPKTIEGIRKAQKDYALYPTEEKD